MNAPVAVFVYNRLPHTQRALTALSKNDLAAQSDVLVFADGAKNAAAQSSVQEVRKFVRSVRGFRSVTLVEREQNLGLARSIIDGVTTVNQQFGRAIVLEDDLVTSPYFLRYMNDALRVYEDDEAVGSIHGYWYPVEGTMPATFFLRGASCWGWATWSRAWSLFRADGSKLLEELTDRGLSGAFDLEGAIAYTRMLKDQIAGRNNSWAIRWHASMYLADKLQLSPGTSLVQNIGFDGSGTHCAESEAYKVELAPRSIAVSRQPAVQSEVARAALVRYYRATKRPFIARAIARARRMIGV